jgi:hypothetical protein
MFDATITSDDFDFMWRYELCDVKGSPFGKKWHDVVPNSHFFIESSKELFHRRKGLKRYIFVKIDLEDDMAVIAGVISVEDFWKKGGDARVAGMKVLTPTTFVDAPQLESFRKFAFGI